MKFSLIIVLFCATTYAQQITAYSIFTSKGKPTTIEKMAKKLAKNEVVFFGEYHDNPISHWLELELLMQFNQIHAGKSMALGLEMFELHQKEAFSNYLTHQSYEKLKEETELWPNFKNDYKPIIDTAISQGNIPFAANITRKYASLVFKKGLRSLDTLSDEAKLCIAPLPFPFDSTLSQYAELIKMGKDMHGSGIQFALSQAIKDATMGTSIVSQLKTTPFVYFLNGAFHSDYHQGIAWYVEQYRAGTKIGTVSTVSQFDVRKLNSKYKGKADFILVVDENMIKTR